MAFTLDGRPQEGNFYVQINQNLRFAYPVKNLDGTPNNEVDLVDVWFTVYKGKNLEEEIVKYTFANGISHTGGTNIINYNIPILSTVLEMGNYYCTINHRRLINGVTENNVMFSGFFKVTNEYRKPTNITDLYINSVNIVDVIGLREELDSRLKYTVRTIGDGVTDEFVITVADGDFLNKPPFISVYPVSLLDLTSIETSTTISLTFTAPPILNGKKVSIGYIPLIS